MPQEFTPPKPRSVTPCEGSQQAVSAVCTVANAAMTTAMCHKLALTVAPAINMAPKAASPLIAPPAMPPPRGAH